MGSISLHVPFVYYSQVVAYNGALSGSNFRNMEAADVKFQMGIGCIRVVFLNKFVMNLLVGIYDYEIECTPVYSIDFYNLVSTR